MAIEERSLLVDFAEVIEEYTERQSLLIKCARKFRANVFALPSVDPQADLPPLLEVPPTHPLPAPAPGHRDYDYFSELDQKLAELEAELGEGISLAAEGVSIADDAPDASSCVNTLLPHLDLETRTRPTALDHLGGLWVDLETRTRPTPLDHPGRLWVDG